MGKRELWTKGMHLQRPKSCGKEHGTFKEFMNGPYVQRLESQGKRAVRYSCRNGWEQNHLGSYELQGGFYPFSQKQLEGFEKIQAEK